MLSTRLSVIASVGLSLLLCLIAAATLYSGEAAAGADPQFATAPNQDNLPRASSGITVTQHALHIPFITAPPAGPCYYTEQGGALVIEIEAIPPVEQWVPETEFPGYTGESYYTWLGPESFSHDDAGNLGLLSYPVWITTEGLYQFAVHNRHDHPDSTLQNDVWFQMGPLHWIKVFSFRNNAWTWASQHDIEGTNDDPPPTVYLTPGLYDLQLSARSHGFSIDRLGLWLQGQANATDLSLPQSPCLYPGS